MGGLAAEEGRETKKGLTKKWRGRARRVTGGGGRWWRVNERAGWCRGELREAVGWSEAVVERRGEFAGRGRRGASVVRHEKMVIPSRMCPMHMHVFPQNGWLGCGAAVRE